MLHFWCRARLASVLRHLEDAADAPVAALSVWVAQRQEACCEGLWYGAVLMDRLRRIGL